MRKIYYNQNNHKLINRIFLTIMAYAISYATHVFIIHNILRMSIANYVKFGGIAMGLYERIKEIAADKGYSINRLEKELKFPRSSIGKFNKNKPSLDKIKKIADFLNVPIDVITGDEDVSASNLTSRDTKEITEMLNNMEILLKQDGLMFDGDPASPEAVDSILSAMKIGMEMAKQKNKEKYTPKKYKKE